MEYVSPDWHCKQKLSPVLYTTLGGTKAQLSTSFAKRNTSFAMFALGSLHVRPSAACVEKPVSDARLQILRSTRLPTEAGVSMTQAGEEEGSTSPGLGKAETIHSSATLPLKVLQKVTRAWSRGCRRALDSGCRVCARSLRRSHVSQNRS